MEIFSDIYSAEQGEYSPSTKRIDLVEKELKKADLMPKYYSAPLFVMWELTSRCPNKCIYCYNDSNSDTNLIKDISTDEAMHFARQLVEAKPFSVCLTGGEPTLREDFFDIASFLKENKIPISTITSGYFMDDEMAKRICEIFDYVQVSVDGPSAGIHDAVRGVKGSFDRAVNACRRLRAYGIKRLAVATSLCKTNRDAFYEMPDFVREELKADELRSQYLVPVGRAGVNKDIELSDKEYGDIVDFLRRKQDWLRATGSSFKLMWGDPSIHISVGRHIHKVSMLRVTADGFYALSPYLPFVMGNIKQNTLQEVWDAGMRTAWSIPVIAGALRDFENIDDLGRIWDGTDGKTVDILPEILETPTVKQQT